LRFSWIVHDVSKSFSWAGEFPMRRLTSIGLTGGIACGKSTAAALLVRKGAYCICADEAARAALAPGGKGWREVVREFGDAILTPAGEIDRKKLGRMVFGDAKKREKLESLVHPVVRRIWRAQLAACAREGKFSVAIVDVPLLYEVGLEKKFAAVIVVASRPQTQVLRLRARGLTRREAKARMEAQGPLQKKMDLADYVIWNDGSRALLRQQVNQIWKVILERIEK
jgi:dephospho-CoA kinase